MKLFIQNYWTPTLFRDHSKTWVCMGIDLVRHLIGSAGYHREMLEGSFSLVDKFSMRARNNNYPDSAGDDKQHN